MEKSSLPTEREPLRLRGAQKRMMSWCRIVGAERLRFYLGNRSDGKKRRALNAETLRAQRKRAAQRKKQRRPRKRNRENPDAMTASGAPESARGGRVALHLRSG